MDGLLISCLHDLFQVSYDLSDGAREEVKSDLVEVFDALILPEEEAAVAAARTLTLRLLPAIERDLPAGRQSSLQSALATFVLYGVGSYVLAPPDEPVAVNSCLATRMVDSVRLAFRVLSRLLGCGCSHLDLRSVASAALECSIALVESLVTDPPLHFETQGNTARVGQAVHLFLGAVSSHLMFVCSTPAADNSSLAWYCGLFTGICQLFFMVSFWLPSTDTQPAFEALGFMVMRQALEALEKGTSQEQLQLLLSLGLLFSLPSRLVEMGPPRRTAGQVLQRLGNLVVMKCLLAALAALPRYAFPDGNASGEQVQEGEDCPALAASKEEAAVTLNLVLVNLNLLLENGAQVEPFIEGGGVQLLGCILGRRNALSRSELALKATLAAAECMAAALNARRTQACQEFYTGGHCRQLLGLIGELTLTKLCVAYELAGGEGRLPFGLQCALFKSLEVYVKVPQPYIEDFMSSGGLQTLMAIVKWDPQAMQAYGIRQSNLSAAAVEIKMRITTFALSIVARVCMEGIDFKRLRAVCSMADLTEFHSRMQEARSAYESGAADDVPGDLMEEQYKPLYPLPCSLVLCASCLMLVSKPARESFMAQGPSGPSPLLRHFLGTARWQGRCPDDIANYARNLAKGEALLALSRLCRDNATWRHWLLKEQRLHELAASAVLHYLPKLKQQAADAIKEGHTELAQPLHAAAIRMGHVAQDASTMKRMAVLNTVLPAALSVSSAVQALDILHTLGKEGGDAVVEVLADGRMKAAASAFPLVEQVCSGTEETSQRLGKLFAWGDQQLAEAQRAADAAAALLLAEEEDTQQRAAAKATKRQRQKAAKRAQQQAQQEQQAQAAEEAEAQQGSSQPLTTQCCSSSDVAGEHQQASFAPAATAQAAATGAHEGASHAAAEDSEHAPLPLQERPGCSNQSAAAGAAGAASQAPQKGNKKKKKKSKGGQAEQRAGGEAAEEEAQQGGQELQHSLPAAALASRGCSSGTGNGAGSMPNANAPQGSTPATAGAVSASAEPCSLPDEQELEFQALLSHLLPGCTGNRQPQPVAVEAPAAAAQPTAVSAACTKSCGWASSDGSGVVTKQLGCLGSTAAAPKRVRPVLAAALSCPLTGELLRDPVIAADGYTYERWAIEAWVQGGSGVSPVTGLPLGLGVLRPNFAVRELVRGLGA